MTVAYDSERSVTSTLAILKSQDEVVYLTRVLREQGASISHPLLPCLILLEMIYRNARISLETWFVRLRRVRHEIRMNPYAQIDDDTLLTDGDLVRVIQEFTEVLLDCIMRSRLVMQLLESIEQLEDTHRLFSQLNTVRPAKDVDAVSLAITDRLQILKSSAAAMQHRVKLREAEVQAQILTVSATWWRVSGRGTNEGQVAAMIGTQDSQQNYKAAEASLRVAEDSRKVAILTRQDSTDMRVIAVATLVFLPGTFVAVR